HGERIMRTAEAHGVTPEQWADSIVPRWTELWEALDISHDDFIRTTEPRHERPVQAFVQALYDRGEVYAGTYEGLYCVGCEAFKQPDDLVDGKCPLHGTEPEVVREENYFFRLSAYADRLIELYESRPGFVAPEARRNEVLGKVKQGLDDLSISRVSFDWGVPIPWDTKHVIYVWIDALLNYITAIGYGDGRGEFDRVWPADVHLMGKDILWFHSVIWPAMLMALDLPVPRTVFAHGYLQVGGQKMSKSRLTGISPHDLLPTFGSDGYRYYFLREISFGQDGNFSWEGMVERYNSDLANDFGNLASRVLAMIRRYLGGTLPESPAGSETEPEDRALEESFQTALEGMRKAVDELAPHEALKAAWVFVRRANAYVEEVAPWALARDRDERARRRLEVVLYRLADALRLAALVLSPAVPRAAQQLWERLGLPGGAADASLERDGTWGRLPSGTSVSAGAPLFPRLDEAAGR
ncbi:MAG TPA: class I tRNA ligase family protein, partial [Actinomycetota bacterium]|nr:class I tRNA ligase family protein [Actinomycetota bacterium]